MCKKQLKSDVATASSNSDTNLSSERTAGDAANRSETDVETTPQTPEDATHHTENGNGAQTEGVSDTTATEEAAPSANKGLNLLTGMQQSLSQLENLFKHQIARNQNQQQMFDTLYREMRDYKENALLEAIQKPIVHNLIQFYDSFVLLESQLTEICDEETQQTDRQATLTHLRSNFGNLRFELEEILYRMNVRPYEPEERSETLDRALHKTVETLPTPNPDEDQKVTRIRKVGFYWREKVIRPEEVTILRYKPSGDEPQETVENPNTEKETDVNG